MVEGAHYLATGRLAEVQARGQWNVTQTWQDEEACHGPTPRQPGYWDYLVTSATTGSCAAMVLYQDAMAIDSRATAAARASNTRAWWSSATIDLATQVAAEATAAASAPSASDRKEDDTVEVIVFYAGQANLQAAASKKNGAPLESARLAVSWNHPAVDKFGTIAPMQFGPGFVVGKTHWATYCEATQGPRPKEDWGGYKPCPVVGAWRRSEATAESPEGEWERVADYFRLDFHTVPVNAYRTVEALEGFFCMDESTDHPPARVAPLAVALGLQQLASAQLCAVLAATPPAGIGDPDATCV